jgi:hypothetical protein
VKSDQQVKGAKLRRRTSSGGKGRRLAIGTRPLKFPMTLRRRRVEVEVRPVVTTTTHVNYEVIITCQGKTLDWVPNRAERAQIGHAAGMLSVLETNH